MQLKITGWIHFEKFRGMYAGDQCRRRSRSPRRSPPSDQVEPSVTVADPMTTTTPTAPAARPSSVHTGPGTTTFPTAPPIERPYGTAPPIERPIERPPRAVYDIHNNVTVNVFNVSGDNNKVITVTDTYTIACGLGKASSEAKRTFTHIHHTHTHIPSHTHTHTCTL